MLKRSVVAAVLVVVVARWWQLRRKDFLPRNSSTLPERVQTFLKLHNLTDVIDGELAALSWEVSPRPGQKPEAPKRKRHPVVMVPGITSCGLEVWKAHPCLGDGFFRRRIWGDLSMAEAILSNWTCWLEHLQPDPLSGMDPEGIRVRAAKGLKSSDYFVGNFWIWAKTIASLADIGYDEDDMLLACYDWRLAFPILEKRDKYFTGLRLDIEKLVLRTGHKAVVLGHSMGANVWIYFMSWVEHSHPGWCDTHIDTFVNMAGAILGALGPLAGFMSGEMDATAALGPFTTYVENLALSFDQIREVIWSMGGVGALLPMGGSAVWGSSQSDWTDSPTDALIYDFGEGGESLEAIYDQLGNLLAGYPSWNAYHRGVMHPSSDGEGKGWGNPLASALPKAPDMKIYCIYGTGMSTERSYKYGIRHVRWAFADVEILPESKLFGWSGTQSLDATIAQLRGYAERPDWTRPIKIDAIGHLLHYPNMSAAIDKASRLRGGDNEHPDKWVRIQTSYQSNDTDDPWDNGVEDGMYVNGVAKTDGDSTVPLVSLGYMCQYGWRDFKEFNPSNIQVRTKEVKHEPSSMLSDPRGGPGTAKHVEIIGNDQVIMDVLRIAAGETEPFQEDEIHSNLTKFGPIISKRIRRALRSAAAGR